MKYLIFVRPPRFVDECLSASRVSCISCLWRSHGVFDQVGVYPHQSSLASIQCKMEEAKKFNCCLKRNFFERIVRIVAVWWVLLRSTVFQSSSLPGRHWEALELSDCSSKEEIKAFRLEPEGNLGVWFAICFMSKNWQCKLTGTVPKAVCEISPWQE